MRSAITKTTAIAFVGGVAVAAVLFLALEPERPAARAEAPPAATAVAVPTISAPELAAPEPATDRDEPVAELKRSAPVMPKPVKAEQPRPVAMVRSSAPVPATTPAATVATAPTPAAPATAASAPAPESPVSVLGQAAEAITPPPPPPAADAAKAESRPAILRPDAVEIKRAQESRTAETVTIPAGTVINVRMNQGLSSERHASGDSFGGTLDQPLVIDGMVIAERGARVDGQVAISDKGGRASGKAQLSIRLVTLHTSDNQRVSINTDEFRKEAEGSVKSDATKVAIGAGVGAALGAIFGGGKGAAIGAGVGGAGGAGSVLLTRGKPAEIGVETRIPFRLRDSVTITEKID